MRILGLWCVLLVMMAGCSSGHKGGPPRSGFIVEPGGPQAVSPQSAGPQGIFNQPQPQTILVQGNVKNHVIGWTEDLTLAQALINAEYRGLTSPRSIVVVRQGQANLIDMNKFLRGKENPLLEPGDVVDLRF